MDNYYPKYLKYKKKYLDLKTLINGGAAAASAPKDKDITRRDYLDKLFERTKLVQFAKENKEKFDSFIEFLKTIHKNKDEYTPDFFFRSERLLDQKDRTYPFGNDPNIYETDILYVFEEMMNKNLEVTPENFQTTLFGLYDIIGHMGL